MRPSNGAVANQVSGGRESKQIYRAEIFRNVVERDSNAIGGSASCGKYLNRIVRLMKKSLLMTIGFIVGLDVCLACAQSGPSDGWHILRPTDGKEFEAGTRLVSVYVSKPFGDAALLRIEDPDGNVIEDIVPAIIPFFSRTIDAAGEELTAGHWEITLFNTLDLKKAVVQSSFFVLEGEADSFFPTIEVPPEGAIYPSHIPHILFGGVTGSGNRVWLEVYNAETNELLFSAEAIGMLDGVWGYVRYWSYGAGTWLAVSYGGDPSLGTGATDATIFQTIESDELGWPEPDAEHQ